MKTLWRRLFPTFKLFPTFQAWVIVVVVGTGLFAASPATASTDQLQARLEANNNPVRDLTLEQLGDVQVTTVTKEPEEVWDTSAAIYVITQEDIQRSGATSIADVLRLAPGVEVGRIDSDSWAVGIRGSESNFSKAVLVLIDGRSVYTPLFAGVYWDVQDVLLEDIDRVEVIRGPGATVWGPNAADGVINIITKKASETQGVMVSVLGGNVDHMIAETQYGGSRGKNFNYRVYGKGFLRGPEFHTDHHNFDDWNQARGGFRADWNINSRNDLTLEGDMYGGDFPHETGPSAFVDSVSGGDMLGRWERTMENGSNMYLQAYFDRTIRIGPLSGETRNTIDIDFLHHLKFGDRQDVSYGGGLRWSPNRYIPKTPVLDVLPETNTDHIYSGFLQDEIHFADDRFTLTLGAKLQHNNFSGFDVQPTVRGLWKLNPHQSLWAAVTRAVTTPSRIEEGIQINAGEISAAPPIFLVVSGNPHFQSETSLGYEGGYRQLLTHTFYVDFSVFHNGYDNLQSFGAPTLIGNNLTIFYENAIAGTTNGIEIAPNWNPRPWWKLSGSYSYVGIDLHANEPGSDISSTGSVNTYEGSSPAHQLKIQSRFDILKRFQFDQTYWYESALPAQGISAYQTMDLRLGWNPAKEWNVSLVGQNLFQPHHFEWGTGDPTELPIGIRRAAYVKLTWIAER